MTVRVDRRLTHQMHRYEHACNGKRQRAVNRRIIELLDLHFMAQIGIIVAEVTH